MAGRDPSESGPETETVSFTNVFVKSQMNSRGVSIRAKMVCIDSTVKTGKLLRIKF